MYFSQTQAEAKDLKKALPGASGPRMDFPEKRGPDFVAMKITIYTLW